MAILAGIDEAGFGPILGPLLVSSSVFRVPDNLVWADFWKILKKSVSDKRTNLTGRLLIADSKKAFIREQGLGHLERTVLAALKYLGREPKNLTEILSILCPDCIEHLREYPWYKNIDQYSLGSDKASIGIAVKMLTSDLAENNIELLDLSSRCLEVAYYNKMVSAVKNKSKVLFTAVASLMQETIDKFKNEDIEIVTDRQGGRSHYRPALQLLFPDGKLRIIHEDDNRSSYELDDGKRKIRMHFIVGADDKYLPVSLASMACKYIRELLVDNLNNYFLAMNSQIKPTAGYWKDGSRFIADIKTYIPQAKFDSNQLIRCR